MHLAFNKNRIGNDPPSVHIFKSNSYNIFIKLQLKSNPIFKLAKPNYELLPSILVIQSDRIAAKESCLARNPEFAFITTYYI